MLLLGIKKHGGWRKARAENLTSLGRPPSPGDTNGTLSVSGLSLAVFQFPCD